MILTLIPQAIRASSFDVVVGRFYLAQSNLPFAYTAFANASDPEGKVLKGLTSLALIQRETNTVNLLNKLHYTSPTNIWQVQTVGYQESPTRPTPYRTVSGTRGAQLVSILRDTHLPVLAQAETDLAVFTDNSQLVPLGRSETGNPDINLDRGDILMIRSLLACGRFLVKIANSQNIDVVVNDYLLLDEEPGPVTIEKVLSRFPDLAKLANSADLPFARNEAKNAINLYKQASEWIRSSRPLGVVRLFNLPGSFGVNSGEVYTASLADEAKFRAKLDEYAALLDGSSAITGFDNGPLDTFNGKPFFDGSISVRALLPSFRKNKIRQGDVTDAFAKAGGMYPGNTIAKTEAWLLQETMECALDPYAFGLFVPPQLSINSSPGNSVSEGYQPSDSFLAVGYSWGYFNDDGLGLFWINPLAGNFSKLNPNPIELGNGYPQESWLSGSSIYIRITDWSTWPNVTSLYELSQSDGHSIRTILLNERLPSGDIYKVLDSQTDFLFILYSNADWKYHLYKMDKTTLATRELDLGSNALNYITQGSWTLDPTGQNIWLAGGNNNTPGINFFKFRISTGELLQTVPLDQYPNWSRVVAGKNSFIALRQTSWPAWSLVSVSYSTGTETVLSTDLFPGRQYDWDSGLTLDATGENVFLRSFDSGWNNQMLHLFSGSNGQLLQSYAIGQPGKDLYVVAMAPILGVVTIANRTGDVSEPIAVSFSINGTATQGMDFTFPNTNLSLLPGNTQQPLSLALVDDQLVEFDETVVLTAIPNPESDSTFQPFTLTIVDNDGSGVGIIATDNAGKEGRMNPDPFGFRFGLYDPIRFEVRRTGPTATPISVRVNRDALLSSASPDDYEITGFDVDGQSVRIPAGSSSAEIVVSPKFDINYPEGTESLTLRVAPDPNYTVMEASSATGSIADSAPYEWWSYQMGLLVANQSPALDVDGDGMPNLLEMALGRDPNLPDSANAVLQGRDSDGYLTLSFKRWTGGINNSDGSYTQYGVIYTPQGTSSLESPDSWNNSALQVIAITDTGDGMEQVTIRDMLSKMQSSRFLRLKTTISD